MLEKVSARQCEDDRLYGWEIYLRAGQTSI